MTGDNTSLNESNCVYMIDEYKVKPMDMKKALKPFVSITSIKLVLFIWIEIV